ncbi:MAG: GTPase Era [Thermodesulfovibrionales bacterium]|nr:GTPase Era [Thermodesulfovibrionales bacterium]
MLGRKVKIQIMKSERFKSGYVSISGKPNVGKSTLLNTILGQKISIVTPKPQTTRNRILGIKTTKDAQIIFIDTPGIHRPKHMLGQLMMKSAKEAVREVDIILLLVEPTEPSQEDIFIIENIINLKKPTFLIINKVDTIKKPYLLPLIEKYNSLFQFTEIIPISALEGDGIDVLLETIVKYLPEGPKYYPDDLITDQLERFMVSEIIREKIMQSTEEEVPYSVATEVVDWQEREDGTIFIKTNIYVEREGQKGIIIGKGGEKLKAIGIKARVEIERLLDTKVFLELWVKLKKDWRSNEKMLKRLGFK